MKVVSNMKESLVKDNTAQGVRPAGKSPIRFGTVNVGTISARANEIAEMLTRRKVDLCCLQETRWRGGTARLIKGKSTIYKFFWFGDQSGFGGVGIMLAQKWINNVISVKRYDHRCLQLRFLVVNVVCCYAPSSLSVDERDTFYERLFSVVASVPEEEMLVLGVDFNGHVGEPSAGFEGVQTRMVCSFLIFLLPTSLQLPTLSFKRITATLLHFHLVVITRRLITSLLEELN